MNNKSVTTKTRFAPSPSGFLHIGNIRTALLNYLYAKKNNGIFILRIDDTNVSPDTHDVENYIEHIKFNLEWLGLEYDEFHKQSDRTRSYEIFANLISHMVDV